MYDIIHDMTKRVNTYESRGFTLLGLFTFFYFFLLLYVVYLAVCPEDDTPCKLYDVLNLPLSCLAYRWSAATRPTEWPDSWGITLWTISCLWHFSELFAPKSLHHNAGHVNQSFETEHSSPKEIICHQGMEELANPPFLSLLLLRARRVAYLLFGD